MLFSFSPSPFYLNGAHAMSVADAAAGFVFLARAAGARIVATDARTLTLLALDGDAHVFCELVDVCFLAPVKVVCFALRTGKAIAESHDALVDKLISEEVDL